MYIKKVLYFLILTASLWSCEKETIVRYEVKLTADFAIPAGINTVETHYFRIQNVPVYYKKFADNKGIDTSAIFQIQASKGLIKSKFQDIDFDFVERISVYVVSRTNPSLKREMYYVDFVPLTTGSELKMLSSISELKSIIKDEFVDLEVKLNVRSIPRTNIDAIIEFSYAVF
jgi:hypothetical protein